MILPKIQKYFDWLLILLINFMWATQVPVIKLIGERLGPVAIACRPNAKRDFSGGWRM